MNGLVNSDLEVIQKSHESTKSFFSCIGPKQDLKSVQLCSIDYPNQDTILQIWLNQWYLKYIQHSLLNWRAISVRVYGNSNQFIILDYILAHV